MRITAQERQATLDEITRRFGRHSRVWLFGSRADDSKRGGDVDIYVEAEHPPKESKVKTRINAAAALENIYGGVSVDLVVRYAREPEQPIHRIAKDTGVALT
jgi:predicted nucleotidyltransferase